MRFRLCILTILMALTACHHLDDQRIPPAPVRLQFYTVAEWTTYGVVGAMSHRRYIKEQRVPSNFPYTALSQTGFGGLLIVGDILGAPRAYDLACPVECKADVRIVVDEEALNAFCPKCGSIYSVFSNYGQPLSGPAAELGYGLQKYYVGAGSQGEYMIVTR
ncbi:MAG: TFIIB-type zinc ribbon-containing protein [Muribaculaceae bacterium]|nr:TFIIB-type zinc ribbon-containing protein [Muribaculaceae bacterium]